MVSTQFGRELRVFHAIKSHLAGCVGDVVAQGNFIFGAAWFDPKAIVGRIEAPAALNRLNRTGSI